MATPSERSCARLLPLAGELLPLHVAPDAIGHLGRADRGASHPALRRVAAALEADRVPTERRLFRLRHLYPSFVMIVALGATSRGYYYHMYEGTARKNTTSRGVSRDLRIPGRGTGGFFEEHRGFAGA